MEISGRQFFFKNRNEKNAFGAAMAIFQLTNKIKYKDTDYLYTYMYVPLKNHDKRIESRPYTQFRAKCFKSTLYLLLFLPFGEQMYLTEKLPFSSLLYVQNNLSFRIL